MKDPEVRHILVGLAASTLLAVMLGISYLSKGLGKRAGMVGYYNVLALFQQVDGLRVGDDVTVSGVRVGKVTGMTLDPDFRARVTLAIEEAVPLPVDTSAAIHTDGLFGGKFVVLEPGGDEQFLAEGAVITFTQDSVIVSELLDLVIAEGKAVRGKAANKGS
jgi:phospholipid/cholesterol/gamma-HCH transport system substrate-binding protein